MRVETIGDATLYLGDCLEILPTLPKVDAVITDPPYGIVDKFSPLRKRDGTRVLQWDWDGEKTHSLIRDALVCAVGRLNRPANAFAFCGFDTSEIARDVFRSAAMTVRSWVWVKQCPPPPMPGNRWPSGYELAAFGFDAGAYFGDKRSNRCNVMTADSLRAGNSEKAGHPTQKPLGVMEHLVAALAAPGTTALDPFMGSGTTGVACANLGRKFIGIEINEKYFDIACKRIEAAYAQGRLFA